MAPKYVAFCGLDGSGKDTQLLKLKEHLENECGKKVLIAKVKFTMFSDFKDEIIDSTMLRYAMGFEFAKYYLNLREVAEEYDYVFCNRHKLCYLAYGYPYGVTDVTVVNHIFSIIPSPDLTFYFDINPEISMQRVLNRKTKKLCTQENLEFQKIARDAYEELIGDGIEKVKRINAERSVDKIFVDVKKEFFRRFL